MSKGTVGVIVGSLRRESFSKKAALCIGGLLEEFFAVKFLDISSLAMYNQDLDNEADMPPEWARFRREVKALDAVLFVTPEYNRSVPPVLKNALDVASRPMAENAWKGKPGAVVSVSPGKIGGFGAAQHLRQSAGCLNIYLMQQPEVYLGEIAASIGADGVPDKRTLDFLRKFAGAFIDWVNKFVAIN